ncbi:MAG: DUF1330 domain-containing protein [Pseudomonadota bacterium]
MAKGYWIAHVSAQDATSFQSDAYQSYVAGAAPAFQEFQGKFLARGGEFVTAEGPDIGARHVVIEFPSLEAAKACYNSETYSQAKQHRTVVSNATIILLEGIDG